MYILKVSYHLVLVNRKSNFAKWQEIFSENVFRKRQKNTGDICLRYVNGYLLLRYSSIPFAATFPAPMAEITVAAPVTASPPA